MKKGQVGLEQDTIPYVSVMAGKREGGARPRGEKQGAFLTSATVYDAHRDPYRFFSLMLVRSFLMISLRVNANVIWIAPDKGLSEAVNHKSSECMFALV